MCQSTGGGACDLLGEVSGALFARLPHCQRLSDLEPACDRGLFPRGAKSAPVLRAAALCWPVVPWIHWGKAWQLCAEPQCIGGGDVGGVGMGRGGAGRGGAGRGVCVGLV